MKACCRDGQRGTAEHRSRTDSWLAFARRGGSLRAFGAVHNHFFLVHEYAPAKHVKMMDCKTASADRCLPNTPDGIRGTQRVSQAATYCSARSDGEDRRPAPQSR